MNKKNNTIEINGRKYDAHTGVLLNSPETPKVNPTTNSGQNVDGVMPRSQISRIQNLSPAQQLHSSPKTQSQAASASKPVMDIHRQPPKTIAPHKPQSAKTLMRRAVHKPSPSIKRLVKAQGVGNTNESPVIAPTANIVSKIDPNRGQRANSVPRNNLVKRFNPKQTTTAHRNTNYLSPSATADKHRIQQANQQANTVVAQNPQIHKDIFQQALEKSKSHEQPFVEPSNGSKNNSKRLQVIMSSSIAILLLGGFLIFHNLNAINLYVASNKAGFQASLPGYNPSGFSLRQLTGTTGKVSVLYTSNSDSRKFKITEQPSGWDSATLRQSFVNNVAQSSYQTIQSAGITIFVYGQNNATWVNGGIWYQLKSYGSLSNQQLIEIATSL